MSSLQYSLVPRTFKPPTPISSPKAQSCWPQNPSSATQKNHRKRQEFWTMSHPHLHPSLASRPLLDPALYISPLATWSINSCTFLTFGFIGELYG